VSVPPNAEGQVHLPAAAPEAVTESGRPLAEAEGVSLVRAEAGAVVVAVGSGTYAFQIVSPPA
jgi:alpha-L-rhamnosidase